MKQNRANLFGLRNSSEAYELRDFLKRSGFPFEWIDLKTDDDARRLAGVTGLNDPRLPACVMEKSSVLFRPTIRDLAAALDWFRGPEHERSDLRIYGAGPAGLSAAVYQGYLLQEMFAIIRSKDAILQRGRELLS